MLPNNRVGACVPYCPVVRVVRICVPYTLLSHILLGSKRVCHPGEDHAALTGLRCTAHKYPQQTGLDGRSAIGPIPGFLLLDESLIFRAKRGSLHDAIWFMVCWWPGVLGFSLLPILKQHIALSSTFTCESPCQLERHARAQVNTRQCKVRAYLGSQLPTKLPASPLTCLSPQLRFCVFYCLKVLVWPQNTTFLPQSDKQLQPICAHAIADVVSC